MWKIKILIQFILGNIPYGDKLNYIFQYLNNSHNDDYIRERMFKIFKRLKEIDSHRKIEGAIVMEMGTGHEAIGSVIFYIMGAKEIYTYDHLPHVRINILKKLIQQISLNIYNISEQTGIAEDILYERVDKIKGNRNLTEIFQIANIHYFAPGDATKTCLKGKSIDIVYSYDVLEHISESVIHAFFDETKRVIKTNGIASHSIGLHDHYVKFGKDMTNINFLKFSDNFWNFFIQNKISYHNRLREVQFLDFFKSNGARILDVKHKLDSRDVEALKSIKINKKFSGMSPEDLAINYSEILIDFQ